MVSGRVAICAPREHDAEKCERFSDDIMLLLIKLEQDSDFGPTRPKIILFWKYGRQSIGCLCRDKGIPALQRRASALKSAAAALD
ncbi:hypothetical protein ELH97_02465 [Rhizobium leguminosarum]|nr:hypothetical protein ELI06_02445 [Rhizobium leguminosarum]TAX37912.1 hypothetical protein ELI05_02455 [Rhizobium leguminosarum]TAX90875.1 hypothetical protein ELH97_02465 [Rhizobium leguminosarum]TAX95464.1 hypothetical protein ELH94_02445 [Rhizobium leguminosarum]TAY86762.1 hypothetical protein ELH83_02465 [Rhizobium leguminosarum]